MLKVTRKDCSVSALKKKLNDTYETILGSRLQNKNTTKHAICNKLMKHIAIWSDSGKCICVAWIDTRREFEQRRRTQGDGTGNKKNSESQHRHLMVYWTVFKLFFLLCTAINRHLKHARTDKRNKTVRKMTYYHLRWRMQTREAWVHNWDRETKQLRGRLLL